MPVYAEIISQPEPADADDIALLYPKDSDKLLAAADKGKLILVGGRFNGRLIAALTLTPIHDGDYQMARLTVREITRGRGVARQLLIQTFKQLPDDLKSISADLRSAPGLVNLFSDLGFTQVSTYWRWQRPQH
ncbi:acetyl-CoA sensor PanZ family protein [Spongiibacter nanhainus]|uniref:Acetyl-CoA sensor PanZ family protein n=1 Tax=Spongiibacter nanhainus TaxID=2794344 RepID=A0A7T4UR00_9GAMM|nr:acetyl-CoA sensor PanZ family protein [Spongiibacter nanhainus]QQD18728.1 acetyl-CoA sensor PanZ family protein [Spongiibacter nanhainus]